jgi:predicted dehydrogenase
MAGKLKIGIIGAGMISEEHLTNYSKDPRVELVWIADVIEERAKARAKEFKVSKAVADYRKVLREVDAVSVCTPPAMHLQPAKDAAAAGRHVLCEKPMTMNAAQAKEMEAACAKAKVQLGVCSARSNLVPEIAIATGYVKGGKLGRVYYARVTSMRRRGRPGLDFWPNVTWFLDMSKAGGGAIMDIGCYDIDLLLKVLGAPQPVAVSAACTTEIGSQRVPKGVVHDVEEHVTAFVRFEDGASATFETAWATNMDGNDFVVFGTMGGIRLRPLTYFGEEKGKTFDRKLDTKGIKLESMQSDFASACLGKKAEPSTPGHVGVKIMQIIESALKSAKTGKEVRIG